MPKCPKCGCAFGEGKGMSEKMKKGVQQFQKKKDKEPMKEIPGPKGKFKKQDAISY
jgi:hypothetical protein